MLKPFLADLARTPFAWGETDCAMTIANWWRVVHGVDPAADLRGAYASADECEALVVRAGGLLRLVDRIAARAGARRTSSPLPGDFAVLRIIDMPDRWWCGIMTPSGFWQIKSEDAVSAYAPSMIRRVVRAWEI